MNIYDEALEEIKKVWNGNPLTYPEHTIKALERAKKVEVLLELYREYHRLKGLEKETNKQYGALIITIYKIERLEKELGEME